MAKKPFQIAPQPRRYGKETHRPLNQLLLIAPLLAAFQIGAAKFGSDLLIPHYLRYVLLQMGMGGQFLTTGLVVVVLLAQHITRKDPWRVSGWVAGGMFLESAGWSIPLLAVHWLTGPGAVPSAIRTGLLRGAVEAIGAGVYEEFLFRLVLLSLLMLVFLDLLHLPRERFTVVSILLAGAVFATFHFSPAQWTAPEAFPWGRFAFLSLAGAWWGVLFVWRGYAVAACSHIWWNLFVIGAAGG